MNEYISRFFSLILSFHSHLLTFTFPIHLYLPYDTIIFNSSEKALKYKTHFSQSRKNTIYGTIYRIYISFSYKSVPHNISSSVCVQHVQHQRQQIGLHVEKCDGMKPPTFNTIYNSEATVLIILGKKQHTIEFSYPRFSKFFFASFSHLHTSVDFLFFYKLKPSAVEQYLTSLSRFCHVFEGSIQILNEYT